MKFLQACFCQNSALFNTPNNISSLDLIETNVPLLTDNLIEQLAPNTYEKQKNQTNKDNNSKYNNEIGTPLKTFYNKHQNLTEKEPQEYTGSRTFNNVLKYLGSTDNITAKIKTPIENVTFNRNNLAHLIIKNEEKRLSSLNKVVRTLQAPNLIVQSIENGKEYKYYIKSFEKEGVQKGHLQVIKCKPDGNFYVTNYPLRNDKFSRIINNGQIIYDLSDQPAIQKNVSDNNIITNKKNRFNPDTTKPQTTNEKIQQVAPNIAKKRGIVNKDVISSKDSENRIAKLEAKIKKVGRNTVLGKKYQKQIDELKTSMNNTRIEQPLDTGKSVEINQSKEEEQALKTKKGFYYDKAGNKHEFEYVDEPPQGYKVYESATTAPKGYTWYTNGKPLLKGRKNILVKDTPLSNELKGIQNTEKYKNLPVDIQQAIDFVFEKEPVYNVTGKEFPNNGENLNERVYQYYKDNFDNKVSVNEIGEIKLDKRSIKDCIYHGTNENKMNAFVAVPYVIKKGRTIDVTKKNNNAENRYLFIAPISLKGEKYFCEVVVKSNKDRQGFYLHEVELTKKLADVFSTAQHGTSTSSKSIIANLINNLNPDILKNVLGGDNNIYFQTAYHGGAKDFDNFDLSYALTGEGAMAHGYGVYLAKNKDVSEGYRKNLSQPLKNAKYDGIPLYKTELSKLHSVISEKLYLKGKDEALKELNRLKEQSEKNKDKDGFLGRSSREFLEKYNEQLELLNSVDESKITGVNKGQLFEVDIPENDVLLDEDKTLNEQSDKVKKAILEYYKSKPNDYIVPKDINSLSQQTGKNFYRDVAFQLERENSLAYRMANGINTNVDKNFNAKKEASLLLNSLGIKGIKYDGHQDGECYVIFDDKAVEILKKYYQEQPEQIKSVDNQGTFDETNPNIYYKKDVDIPEFLQNYNDERKDFRFFLKDKEIVYDGRKVSTLGELRKHKSFELVNDLFAPKDDNIEIKLLEKSEADKMKAKGYKVLAYFNADTNSIYVSKDFTIGSIVHEYTHLLDYRLNKNNILFRIENFLYRRLRNQQPKNEQEKKAHFESYKSFISERYAFENEQIANERLLNNDKRSEFGLPAKRTLAFMGKISELEWGRRRLRDNVGNGERISKTSKSKTKTFNGSLRQTTSRNDTGTNRGINNNNFYSIDNSDIKSHIPDDIDEILPKVKPPKDNVLDRTIGVISTRANNISPKIKHALRRFEFENGMNF